MARKSATVIGDDNSIRRLTNETKIKREKAEKGMQTNRDKLYRSPSGLTEGQRKIFKKIIEIDEERKEEFRLLCNADIDSIVGITRELDSYNQLEVMKQSTSDVELLLKIMRLQDTKFPKIIKYLGELGMTPSGRAANANAMSKINSGQSTLEKILGGDDDE